MMKVPMSPAHTMAHRWKDSTSLKATIMHKRQLGRKSS